MLPDINLKPPFICPCIHVLMQTHTHPCTYKQLYYIHTCVWKRKGKNNLFRSILGKGKSNID